MTFRRIQQFCRKYNINIAFFNGKEVCLKNNTEKNIASKLHKKHFCLIWKSNGISFSKKIEELKNNFKIVDSVISDKNMLKDLLNKNTNQKKFNLNQLTWSFMI